MDSEHKPAKKPRHDSASDEPNGLSLLDWLPSELLLLLLSFVRVGDLGRLSVVCTGLRDLASHGWLSSFCVSLRPACGHVHALGGLRCVHVFFFCLCSATAHEF
eukprot:TRINITY_DN4746_c0_g1_i3.p3 TRINITY_DN4746_c0_g1~~TRINITY_DN4746_c0_g1_i3.p3  ORF type:complete len:104 (-),score=9.55 TRINITY_DN4746_c0_g1_i3:121-432(-)